VEVEVPASYPIVFTSTLSASGTLWAASEHTPSSSSTRRRGRFGSRPGSAGNLRAASWAQCESTAGAVRKRATAASAATKRRRRNGVSSPTGTPLRSSRWVIFRLVGTVLRHLEDLR
jgi:hypothetical protein